jgi:hypothetical protein
MLVHVTKYKAWFQWLSIRWLWSHHTYEVHGPTPPAHRQSYMSVPFNWWKTCYNRWSSIPFIHFFHFENNPSFSSTFSSLENHPSLSSTFATLKWKTKNKKPRMLPSRRRAARCSGESGWKGWMMIIELAIVISWWTELVGTYQVITGSSRIVKTKYARQLRCICFLSSHFFALAPCSLPVSLAIRQKSF